MKTAAIIYHRIDFDGICAYAIARRAAEANGYIVTPFPFSHGDTEPSLGELFTYDYVAILDVCLCDETMRALFKRDREVPAFCCAWIDHHCTALRNSVVKGYSMMKGYRKEEGFAACELTWMYYNEGKRLPIAVAYLSAYDVHDKERYNWDAGVLPFQYGMRDRYALRAEDFVDDYDDIVNNLVFVSDMIENGKLILRYLLESGGRGVATYGFPVTVAGTHRGLCCLTNAFGSLPFESQMRQDGIPLAVCANRVTPDRYRVSVYAPGECPLDLGEYMKEHYGGGGHRGAASGTLNLEQFVTLMTRQTL